MALKVFLSNRTISSIVLLLIASFGCWPCHTSTAIAPVRLQEFKKEGVSFTVPRRFHVKNVLVGEASVCALFQKKDEGAPWWAGGYFRDSKISLMIESEEQLKALQRALESQQQQRLKVCLQDERGATWWGWLPGMDSKDFYERCVEIPIVTPCEEVTRIVYTEIYERVSSMLRSQTQQGETRETVDLDELFDKLLKNEDTLKNYVNTLNSVEDDPPCSKTIQLLKLLRGDEGAGFGSGKYYLAKGLKDLLDVTIQATQDARANWPQYFIDMKVTGFTDQEKVGEPKELEIMKTGVDDWSSIANPLAVSYGKCRGDQLTGSPPFPLYIDFRTGGGERISQIQDNCQLGAVRAYVAVVYLMNRLGQKNISYSYATGGVFQKSDRNYTTDDRRRRRLNIEMSIKAARQER